MRMRTMMATVALVALASIGWSATAQAQCGNGIFQPDAPHFEGCDDGNLISGDGCSATCEIETGWDCSTAIDFSALTNDNHSTSSGATWTNTTLFSSTQTSNSTRPHVTIFGADAMATSYTLRMRVNNNSDDDWIGLVLGYQPDDLNNEDADYLLLDWKQADQTLSGSTGRRGIFLHRVEGVPATGTNGANGFWGKTGPQFTNLNPDGNVALLDEGWAAFTNYDFEVTYTPTNLLIIMNGTTIVNGAPPAGMFPGDVWPSGQIGFYGFSQEQVVYELITPRRTFCEPVCGDGIVNVVGGETCDVGDPGNNITPVDGLGLGTCSALTCRYDIAIDAPADGAVVRVATPPVSGVAEAGSSVTVAFLSAGGSPLLDGDNNPITCNATTSSAGAWSCTPSAPLPDGAVRVRATANDGGITTVDEVAITVNTVTNVAISSPPDGTLTQGPVSSISGTTEAGNTVTVSINGGTPIAAIVTGTTWSLTLPEPLSADDVYTIIANATNPGGPTAQATSIVTIDTVTEVAITSHTDGETVDTPITSISGTGEPGATVTVTVGGAPVACVGAPVIVAGDGTWTCTLPTPLTSGEHVISVDILDDAGNTDSDGPITVTVEVNNCTDPGLNSCSDFATCTPTGPGTNTCTCLDGYVGDGVLCEEIPYVTIEAPTPGTVVRTGQPVVSGTGNPNSVVTITVTDDNGVVVTDTTTTDNDGNWIWIPASTDELDEGDYTITATIDLGNSLPPAEDDTSITVLLGDDVIIDSPTDGSTVSTTPTVTGTAPPGATIVITVDGEPVGTTTADDNGQWTWTPGPGEELTPGPVTITATDDNTGSSDTVTVTVDGAFVPVTITSPREGTSIHPSMTIRGTGQPGQTVVISVDGTDLGTTVVGAGGTWAFTPTAPLSPGEQTITARYEDESSSDSVTVTVPDRSTPPAPNDEFLVTGGHLTGCSATGATQLPWAALVALGAVVALRRRRRDTRLAA